MKRSHDVILPTLTVALALALAQPAAAAVAERWTAVDHVLGRPGAALGGGVHKYGWPRTDLHVTLDGVTIEPALALGSWAAFEAAGEPGRFLVMGDLVLQGSEVNPVLRALQAGGIDVTAVHNHLIGEAPRLLYVHYAGRGDAMALARALRDALGKTATPLAPASAPPAASPAEAKVLAHVEAILGRKGSTTGRVLHVGVPRADPIEDGGVEVPPTMGTASGLGFQVVGDRVATAGDLVLAPDEVNPVIAALEAHGLEVEALHTHMLRETPRTFFLHFWGVGSADRVAGGLRAALALVKTR